MHLVFDCAAVLRFGKSTLAHSMRCIMWRYNMVLMSRSYEDGDCS